MAKETAIKVLFLFLATFLAGQLLGQTVTGTITGTVTDPSNQVIVGAKVTLTSDRTSETRVASTNVTGGFTFAALEPGPYAIKVEQEGFKTIQHTGIVLTANDRLSLGDLQLSLGSLAETVTVEAQSVAVQTASADHSSVISGTQVEQLQIRGRDPVSLLKLLPGVASFNDTEALGSDYGTGTPTIGGVSNNSNHLAIDGVTSSDLGTPSVFSSPISVDAIGEVKTLLNSYQAEYGGNGGAVVQIVTKSGTQQFHGSGYWYKRHEMFNANTYFNNQTGTPKAKYRYITLGGAIGGPIYIPGRFNTNKDKLFFFYNIEDWATKQPQGLRQVTMPTALERAGDFSQTVDLNNKMIVIKDPTTNAAFPNNKIPSTSINANGQAILNIFPLPNFTDRAISGGSYNYTFQESLDVPKLAHLFRVDVPISVVDKFSLRGSHWYSDQGGYAVSSGASNWGLFKQHYRFAEEGLTVNWVHIFSPTIVSEFNGGVRNNKEKWYPDTDKDLADFQRQNRGLATLGQWYPQINDLNIIPQASFGGVTGSASLSYDGRTLTGGSDMILNFADNLSVVSGSHSFKFGAYVSKSREYEGARGTFGGNFSFGRDVNNPFDSNYAYSNALLGNFSSYTESTTRYHTAANAWLGEWFAQDSWKVTRRLTIEYGVRFSRFTWSRQRVGQAALLSLERYDPAKAPVLFRPAFDASHKRVAQNPLTGALAPAVMIGAFVPNSGDPGNGGVVSGDPNYPTGWIEQRPIQIGPRFGVAWDPFGKGKTAVRAGAGILYMTRFTTWSEILNPPVQYSPTLYYGNLATYLNSSGVLFPGATTSYDLYNKAPSTYNLSFGIQQDIGFNTLLDASYVGNLGRHVVVTRNLNTVPYGSRFLPQNADPTNPSTPLNDNFFRPMPGYSNVTYRDNSASSNYHSLQLTANHRAGRGVQFGVAYTYSKAMAYGNVPMYQPYRYWTYGLSGSDQTHNLVLNYMWDLPRASRLAPNAVIRKVFDDWQISGITTLASGSPSGVGFSTTDGADITGGGDGGRIVMSGKAALDKSQRSFYRWFDTSVFARPAKGDVGNASNYIFRGPGRNNWDITVFKNVPVYKEGRVLQLRLEMYNAFNKTQYSSVNTTARFDPAGKQTNSQFGWVTGTRAARTMQVSVRFTF